MSNLVLFGVIVTIIVVSLGFIFKKNRVITFLQLAWIFVLMCLNTGGGDYSGNQMIFELSNLDNYNIFNGDLYGTLCFLFKNSNFDYILTNGIFNAFSIAVIYFLVAKHTKNKNFALSLFMIFPMFDFIMQKRMFLAVPFILLSLEVLFANKKYKYPLAITLALISSQLHTSSYFFLVVIALFFVGEKIRDDVKFNKVIYILTLSVFLMLTVIPEILSRFFSTGRITLYFGESNIPLSSAIAWIGIHICFVLLQRYLLKKDTSNDSINKTYEKNVTVLNTISLILTPLYFYESAFFRLFKIILIMNYICISNRASHISSKKKNFSAIISVLYVIFIFLLLYVWTGYGFEVLIEPLFENNLGVEWLTGGVV